MNFFFFITWGDPKFYQTLIFLSQKLSSENYQINIYTNKPEKKIDIIGKVDFGNKCKIIYYPYYKKFLPKFINLVLFSFYCLYQHISIKPNNIIFFNKWSLISFLFIRIFKNNTKLIYHNFDFEIPSKLKSFKEKNLAKYEFFITKYMDFLVFPSKDRAKLFQKKTKIKKNKFLVFQNCFPINFEPKKSNILDNFLKKKKINTKKIICNIGSIGPSHHLSEIIESFKFIDKKCILILAGTPIQNYHIKLLTKINKLKLNNQIYIFKNIKNKLWYEILFRSKVGLCFYKQNCTSHKYMAGTSNKFNNYIMANIPMIVNSNNDFLIFKKNFDIFETANPKKPKIIAKKIKLILNNITRYKQIKKNQKKTFSNYLNFEYQFKKSYDKVLDS